MQISQYLTPIQNSYQKKTLFKLISCAYIIAIKFSKKGSGFFSAETH